MAKEAVGARRACVRVACETSGLSKSCYGHGVLLKAKRLYANPNSPEDTSTALPFSKQQELTLTQRRLPDNY